MKKNYLIKIITILVLSISKGLLAEISPEVQFKNDYPLMTATRFIIAEDKDDERAYMVYKDAHEKRKIRTVWNGGCCKEPIAIEMFFKDKKLISYRELKVTKDAYDNIIDEIKDEAHVHREFHFKNSKMVKWIEQEGVRQFNRDAAWIKQEKKIKSRVRQALAIYPEYKEFEEVVRVPRILIPRNKVQSSHAAKY